MKLTSKSFYHKAGGWLLGVALCSLTFAMPALSQSKKRPSSQLTFTQRLTPGDGYMVAGELWDTIKPMNTEEGNGVEDPLSNNDYLHWITTGTIQPASGQVDTRSRITGATAAG